MAQAARHQHSLLSFLNTDGKAHPVENTLAAVTALLGVVAFAAGLVTQRDGADLHLLASWAGLAGVLTGGWGQFISATTGERFVLILGLGAAAIGLFLGMAYGGLFGGLLG
ncbi:hypothetical protein DVA86_24410 [Streptomyces armeniacus]|uniref:Integral membrane protein n=1 Tax=Streptomyces armeniacus TaxID=83291 RepID=A0A345XUK2_9ACTN|nr:hypothetical protein [Streptomyces armeniacus]AXK35318.1 hypothetical protein DVA86_24410 [Streptomyces armeniacus]